LQLRHLKADVAAGNKTTIIMKTADNIHNRPSMLLLLLLAPAPKVFL
jgi:hypothetical protein